MSAGRRLLLDRIAQSGRPPPRAPLSLGWLLGLAAASWAVLFVLGLLALLALT